jgi:hypothetical protein
MNLQHGRRLSGFICLREEEKGVLRKLKLCFVFWHADFEGRNFMPSDDGQKWKMKFCKHTHLLGMAKFNGKSRWGKLKTFCKNYKRECPDAIAATFCQPPSPHSYCLLAFLFLVCSSIPVLSTCSKTRKLGPSSEAASSALFVEKVKLLLAHCFLRRLSEIHRPYFFEAIGSAIISGSLSHLLCITDEQLMIIGQSCGFYNVKINYFLTPFDTVPVGLGHERRGLWHFSKLTSWTNISRVKNTYKKWLVFVHLLLHTWDQFLKKRYIQA